MCTAWRRPTRPGLAAKLEALGATAQPLGLLLAIGLAASTWVEPGRSGIHAAEISPAATNPARESPRPGWLNSPGPSVWKSRPWVYGWYRVHPEAWSWWGVSSARWGLASLAPAATITALVQAALSRGSTVIVVPGGTDRLDLGSLQAVRPMGVRFLYAGEAQDWSPGSADCQAGLVADQPPQTALEAQRLNAACQVTYGNP